MHIGKSKNHSMPPVNFGCTKQPHVTSTHIKNWNVTNSPERLG